MGDKCHECGCPLYVSNREIEGLCAECEALAEGKLTQQDQDKLIADAARAWRKAYNKFGTNNLSENNINRAEKQLTDLIDNERPTDEK